MGTWTRNARACTPMGVAPGCVVGGCVARGRVYRQACGYVAAGRAREGEYDHQDSLGQAVFIFSILVVGYGKFEITLKRLLLTTRILLGTEKVNFRAGIIFRISPVKSLLCGRKRKTQSTCDWVSIRQYWIFN